MSKYRQKIENTLKNKKEIFEDTVWSTKTYAIISNDAIVHINRNTGAFITSHPINQKTIDKMYRENIKVIPK